MTPSRINHVVDGAVSVTVVAVLELSSGLIAACIPACMPFITFRRKKERPWYSLSTAKQTVDMSGSGGSLETNDPQDAKRGHKLQELPKHDVL